MLEWATISSLKLTQIHCRIRAHAYARTRIHLPSDERKEHSESERTPVDAGQTDTQGCACTAETMAIDMSWCLSMTFLRAWTSYWLTATFGWLAACSSNWGAYLWAMPLARSWQELTLDTFARQMRGFGKTWRRFMHESRFDEHTLDATHEDVMEVAFWSQQGEADERWFDFLWKCAHYDEWDTAA